MSVIQMVCPNCGANVQFNADSQNLHCDYCMSDFSSEEIKEANSIDEFNNNAANIPTKEMQEDFNSHTNLFSCDSCGAEIIGDETTAATFCPYCHSAVTLQGRVSGECRPELILPFKFSRENAEEEFLKWCRKKWFLPNDFKSSKQLEKMTGLYVPYWLADCHVNAKINAESKIIHSYESGNYNVTHTKVFDVERAAFMDYLGVPADGSKKLEDNMMDAVEPFDYQQLKPFSMTYLSGFFADRYDVSKSEVLPRIKSRIDEGAVAALRDDINGYTTTSIVSKYVNIIRTNWHYAMLPVWFMTYKYHGKTYFFGLNGQSGKVAGIPPVSKGKVSLFALIMFLLFGFIGFLIGGNLS